MMELMLSFVTIYLYKHKIQIMKRLLFIYKHDFLYIFKIFIVSVIVILIMHTIDVNVL